MTEGLKWRIVADDTILNFAVEGKPFTACMVRDLMSVVHPGLEPAHPNAWGMRFLSAQKEGIIRTTGFEQSPRKSRHGAIQRVWEGC
jgi:hypothetical protein